MSLWSASSHHPPPIWGSQFLQNSSKICIRLLYCLNYHNFSHFTTFPLFLYSLTSIIVIACLLFGTQGKPRRLKPFTTKNKPLWGFCIWEPLELLLGFNPPFSLTLLNPDRNRDWMGKRNKTFWIERFIMNLAGKLSFRGVISLIKSDNDLQCMCVCVCVCVCV